MRILLKLASVIIISTAVSGCAFLSPSGILRSYSASLKQAVFSQEDPELVEQGMPTLILLVDAALVQNPDDPDLLRTAASMYSTYAQAFLASPDKNDRAALLYSRARKYAFRLLRHHPNLSNKIDAPFNDFEKAVAALTKNGVPDIYTAANAWLGWILSHSDSMEALSELPKALALMKRVLELDESYADGGAHMIFGVYYAVQTEGAGRDLKKSRKHFDKAIEISKGKNLIPYLALAEFYATAAGDEKLFDSTIEKILATENTDDDHYTLMNAIAKKRAEQLMENKDEYFDSDESEDTYDEN